MNPNIHHPALLAKIKAFLAESGMGKSYFGKVSTGNSELVDRIENGGRVWPETERKVEDFIAARRAPSGASS